MLQIILKLIELFMKSKSEEAPAQSAPVPEPESKPLPATEECKEEAKKIDWSKPDSKISKYFTVREATYLPSWNVIHEPSEEEKVRILEVAAKMDLIREFIGESIVVHVWLRPKSLNSPGHEHHGKDYNEWLYKNIIWKNLSESEKAAKKVPNSPHKDGNAVDWSIKGKSDNENCDRVRELLEPKLAEFGIRMEDLSGMTKRNWVHVDTRAVGNKRYFLP